MSHKFTSAYLDDSFQLMKRCGLLCGNGRPDHRHNSIPNFYRISTLFQYIGGSYIIENHTFAVGDWIVHSQYGIGQLKGVDVKGISGEDIKYYRIETSDSTFWVPFDQMDSDKLRPVSTSKEIEQAIAALQKPPQEMSSNYKIRQIRIKEALVGNTPQAFARIIRDLRAQQRKKGVLNESERNAFRILKERLIEEWAIVTGAKPNKVKTILDDLLDSN